MDESLFVSASLLRHCLRESAAAGGDPPFLEQRLSFLARHPEGAAIAVGNVHAEVLYHLLKFRKFPACSVSWPLIGNAPPFFLDCFGKSDKVS